MKSINLNGETMSDPEAKCYSESASEFHEGYREYNRLLRAWFVGFGVGGPVILLTQEKLRVDLVQQGLLGFVVLCFLIGAASQILIAFINKVECWYCFYARFKPSFAATRTGRFMLRLDKQFWIDISCDVITMAAYVAGIAGMMWVYV